MAPTLNSTLIHAEESNDHESSSSAAAVEETEKELSQYSPILAGRSQRPPSSPHPAHSRNAIKATLFKANSLDYATNTNRVRII